MSILSLLYRTAGAWGAGKGSNLTAAEVDQNFYDLEQAVENLAANPIEPAQIEDVTVTDGDQLTFTLSDATVLGPVTLPSAKPVWRGDWTPNTDYVTGDLFEATDPATDVKGLYFTNRSFTSDLAFDPALGIGIGGSLPYASFVLPVPDKVRVNWYWPGKPGEGLPYELLVSDDSMPMFSFLTTDAFFVEADFAGSVARLRGPPTSSELTFDIRQNDIVIGSLIFAAGEYTGTFNTLTSADFIDFAVDDTLELTAPDVVDTTAFGLQVAIVGRLGTSEVDSSS